MYVSLSVDGHLAQAFGFMLDSQVVVESLRELRLWFSPGASHIPWGFVILALCITFICGCCCGLGLGLLLLSRACRSILLQSASVVIEQLWPSTVPVLERHSGLARRRLGEYRA